MEISLEVMTELHLVKLRRREIDIEKILEIIIKLDKTTSIRRNRM